MTTVTEAVKPLLDEEDESAIEDGDLARLCANPAVAQRFARMLTKAAREISPNRDWTPEDLRDVLETAVHGTGQETARVLEGRYFRKRLREQVNLADRYGDSFAVVVITMVKGVSEGVYSSVLDAVTERLRRTDMVFLYRRRFALVLPRMRPAALSPLIERVRARYPEVLVIEPFAPLCDGETCGVEVDGTLLYRDDGSHLTHEGARLLGERFLERLPNPLARSRSR